MNLVKAKNLIDYRRLDLVVKYLYAKEYLESVGNDYSTGVYKDLYIRHILMRTKGVEPARGYEATTKFSVDSYCENFEALIQDIKNNGFNENFPVCISKENLPENGAHRIAASALMDLEIPYIQSTHGYSWDYNWFSENGFNTEDKQRILKGFVDIHSDKCTIFVLWKPIHKYIGNIKAVINQYFDIVGEVDLDFEDNCTAFVNAILEIYEPNISKANGDDFVIREKAKILQADYLSFKVIVATNQHKNFDKNLESLTKDCKSEIRNLFDHILAKECFCTLHSSDGEQECKYLANILLSPNNIKHLRMRNTTEPGEGFVQKIRNLPSFLTTLDIFDSNDVCVIGSGVMTALGIQKEYSDSDFIVDYKYRDRLGWEAVPSDLGYDVGISDKLANRPKNIPDNVLIHNGEYHFWFKGIKFTNLEMIKDRKRFSAREKDFRHLRQIDLFEKMIGHFEQQKILLQRIEDEKQRREDAKKALISHQENNNEPVCCKKACFLQKLFSVKNEYHDNIKHKVIRILGIKIKIGKKYV